jgi:hypothetical protein
VQASNSSLLETHPEIDVEPAIELPDIPEVSHDMFRLTMDQSLTEIEYHHHPTRPMCRRTFLVPNYPLDKRQAFD